ncbi:MAG TPA: RsmB/NOP family class I SAM-dependent RNA methyltransferase [Burkholderiaceae bacterium]|nr:RsmB/NOP family class I SAM-dependent RNA methyltransferase [Burkholderiaceae bacterium]
MARAPRVTAIVVDSLAHALARVLTFEGPADAVMSRYFRAHAQLGRRDRSLIAEAIFYALRHYATLGWSLQPAVPARAPRLAALVTLARQHGLDALDPRALRGDATAVKHALAIELRRAPESVRAELPHWLYLEITRQYDDAAPLMSALTEPAPLDLRVNLMKAARAEVQAELDAHGVVTVPARYSPEAIRLAGKPGLTQWPAYREGRIEVQDEGSQLIARLLQPRRGEMVVDFCAGAGGKTLALGALMRSSGRLYAFDVNARRLEGLGPRLKRSGLSNVHPVAIRSETDARIKRLHGKCDRVLVDAPCSGSGTLRRNPDLKWRFAEAELDRVNDVQRAVLSAAARLLKPGGRLVYATCSLLARENQKVVEEFLAAHPDYTVIPAQQVLAAQSINVDGLQRFAPYFVMLPHLHGTDGFFAAVMERG